MQHAHQHGRGDLECGELEEVAKNAAAPPSNRQAVDRDPADALHSRLARQADADNVHVVARSDERLGFPACPRASREVPLTNDADPGHHTLPSGMAAERARASRGLDLASSTRSGEAWAATSAVRPSSGPSAILLGL